jgi:hypothetical protein
MNAIDAQSMPQTNAAIRRAMHERARKGLSCDVRQVVSEFGQTPQGELGYVIIFTMANGDRLQIPVTDFTVAQIDPWVAQDLH